MDEQSPNPGRVVKRILEEENLPLDLLERALDLPQMQDGNLFEWVMQLREMLNEEEERTVGVVLTDGILVSAAGSESISREAATLTPEIRSSLKELLQEESRFLEQARFVLALDVQNRVHNEVSQ